MAAVDDHSVKSPRFVKIIFEHRGDLNKMGIPKKFILEYGSDLEEVLTLKTLTGKTWKVKLLKENGKAWFKDGWPEFVSYYSITHAHFLMFTYASKSLFDVCIFDKTASEIEYPLGHPQDTRELPKKLNECKTKTNLSSPRFSAKGKGMTDLVTQSIRKFGTLTTADIKKINSYLFETPSFAALMHPSYVNYKFSTNVPSIFAAKYMTNVEESYTLQTPIGDKWRVKSCGKTPKVKKFSWGWKHFALDNNLRVGDVCVFELVKAAKRLFTVEIMRASCVTGVDDDVDIAGASNALGNPCCTKIEVISISD